MEIGVFIVLAILGIVVVGAVVVIVIAAIIRSAFRGVATHAINRALDLGQKKVLDRVLDVGEREIVKGAHELGKTISEEIKKSDPQRMETEVTRIAQEHKGDLTVAKVMAELNVSKYIAQSTLTRLVKDRQCFVEGEGEMKTYVFPAFKEKKKILTCEYCGSTYEPETVTDNKCPSCGAPLKSTKVLE